MLRGSFRNQCLDRGQLCRTDVLGIDGNERSTASDRDHQRIQAFEDLHEQVASDCGLLVDQYALAAQRFVLEEAGESLDPRSARFRILRWKFLVAGPEHATLIKQRLILILAVQPLPRLSDLLVDRRFLLFSQLAFAAIGFVSVAVKWNVAASNHHAALATSERITGERGSGYGPKVDRVQASIADRSHDRLGDLSSAFLVGRKTVGTDPLPCRGH